MDLPVALVVEDEALIAIDMAGMIEAAEWRVLGPAASAAEALRLLEDAKPQIAFVDIQLHRETSAAVVTRLRALAVPIVLTTAHPDPSVAGAEFAGLPTLVKPYDHRILRAIVDRKRGVSYRIDAERRMVFLFGRGALRVDDVLELQRRLRLDPAFDPRYRLLADYRAAISIQLELDRFAEVAANAPFAATARRAFVVHGSVSHEVMRRFQSLNEADASHGKVGIFHDFDAANRWLEAAPS